MPPPTATVWNVLSKFMFATYPVIMAWAVWVTSESFANREFRNAGNRFTLEMGLQLELDLRREMASLPAADWRTKIDTTLLIATDNAKKLAVIESQMSELKAHADSLFGAARN